MEKLQKDLREANSKLDQERTESNYLRAEKVELVTERDRLKHDLDAAKSKLFVNSNKQQSSISESEVNEYKIQNDKLHQKIAELKDSNMYSRNLEGQLETAVQESRELRAKLDVTKDILTEKDASNKMLQEKVSDFQLKMVEGSAENQKLKDTVEELQKHVKELQAINIHRQSDIHMFGGDHRQSAAFDISMDNPESILSPPRGETLGDAVVLNLQDEISSLKSEVEQSKATLLVEQDKFARLQTSMEATVSELQESKVTYWPFHA